MKNEILEHTNTACFRYTGLQDYWIATATYIQRPLSFIKYNCMLWAVLLTLCVAPPVSCTCYLDMVVGSNPR